jgi:thymidylate synthase ThyX
MMTPCGWHKIFDREMADGQESSTRYITMDAANVPSPEEIGVPADLAPRWREVIARSFAAYHAEYARLDALATAEPQRVRVPADAKPAVVTRLRKNYALDRARYFIPLATRTNLGLVQSSRMWATTVKHHCCRSQRRGRRRVDSRRTVKRRRD